MTDSGTYTFKKLEAATIAKKVIDEAISKVYDTYLIKPTSMEETPDQILSRLIENRKAEQQLEYAHHIKVLELSKKIKALEKEKERQAKRVNAIINK